MRGTRGALAASLAVILLLQAAPSSSGAGELDPSTLGELWRHTRDPMNGTAWSLCWSPDGARIAVIYFDAHVLVLNASTGEEEADLLARPGEESRCDGYAPPGARPGRAVAWSPDGRWLAAGGDDRVVFVFDTATWQAHRHLTGHAGSVQSLAWSHDGTRLASGSGRDKVMPNGPGENKTFVWDVETSTVLLRLEGHTDGVLGIAWSPDDSLIATASDDRTARIWNSTTGEELARLEGHTSGVLDCAWSPNGTWLATGSRDYKARLWDPRANLSLGKWSDNNCVRSVDFHPSGTIVATSGVDKTLKFRNARTGSVLVTIDDGIDLDSCVMKSRWDPAGERIAAAYGKSATVILYGPGGAGGDGGPGKALYSGLAVIAIATAGTVVLLYPALRKARRRRG